jgi:hypothetical protein
MRSQRNGRARSEALTCDQDHRYDRVAFVSRTLIGTEFGMSGASSRPDGVAQLGGWRYVECYREQPDNTTKGRG